MIWSLALVAIYLPLALLMGIGNFTLIAVSIALFIAFVIRNLYFVYFEIAWRGSTPGKRVVGIRVIDRAGGPLLPSAVIARNLTREVEIFLPLGILMTGGKASDGTVDFEQLSIAVWLVAFAALPLINRDRMRGGDLIAGTMVIRAVPKLMLLGDPRPGRDPIFLYRAAACASMAPLDCSVLEALLRRPVWASDGLHVLEDVCDKICRKIGWTEPVSRQQLVVAFLRDFYTAERAFLEREQLYGSARADKFSLQPGTTPNA